MDVHAEAKLPLRPFLQIFMEILRVAEETKHILPPDRHNHPIMHSFEERIRIKSSVVITNYSSSHSTATMDRLSLRNRRRRKAWGDITFSWILFLSWQHKTIASMFGGLAMFTSVWWTPERLSLSFQKRRDDGRPTAPADSSQAACRPSPSLTTTRLENLFKVWMPYVTKHYSRHV